MDVKMILYCGFIVLVVFITTCVHMEHSVKVDNYVEKIILTWKLSVLWAGYISHYFCKDCVIDSAFQDGVLLRWDILQHPVIPVIMTHKSQRESLVFFS